MTESSQFSDRKILITGSTDGIGKEAARLFAEQGAHVIVHGRNREKGEDVCKWISERNPKHDPDLLIADFSSLENVRDLAIEVKEKHGDLNLLINNAGVYSEERHESAQGFELTFAVGYLAPFLLSLELTDLLKKNAPSKVVNVTSRLHEGAPLEFDNLQGERSYEGHEAYGRSKLVLTAFTLELAQRLSSSGTRVTVDCLHPGGIDTKLLRAGFGGGGRPPEEGAQVLLHVAGLSPEKSGTGNYFNRFERESPDPRVRNALLRQRLWDESLKMVNPFLSSGKKAA